MLCKTVRSYILSCKVGTKISRERIIHHHLLVIKPQWFTWVDPEGGTGGLNPLLKDHKNIGFPSNTGPDSLKNHKVTNVGPSLAHQQNPI